MAGQYKGGAFPDDPGEIVVDPNVTAIRDAFKVQDPGVIQLQDIVLGSAGDIRIELKPVYDDQETFP
jgi:hypothetical protein